MIGPLSAAPDVAAARALIEGSDLAFETGYDDLVGLYEETRLIAVGARAGRVLKMLTVAPEHRGGTALAEIVTALIRRGSDTGQAGCFVFTKPHYASSFEALNFSLLARHDKVALLEYGGGLKRWLTAHAGLRRPGTNGAVVLNGEPFSQGQRTLVERAAAEVDHLYLLLVRDERLQLPFAERYRRVEEGMREVVRDPAKVIVLDYADYSIGAATFPTYFLKRDDPVTRIRRELDATLFATRIAPHFGIDRRFVGSEPNCPLTDADNEALQRLLPAHGIALIELEQQPPRR